MDMDLYLYLYRFNPLREVNPSGAVRVGLYKILLYFDAFVHDSIIRSLAPPTCIARTIAIPLYLHCAIYDALPTPRFVCHTPYNISIGNIV